MVFRCAPWIQPSSRSIGSHSHTVQTRLAPSIAMWLVVKKPSVVSLRDLRPRRRDGHSFYSSSILVMAAATKNSPRTQSPEKLWKISRIINLLHLSNTHRKNGKGCPEQLWKFKTHQAKLTRGKAHAWQGSQSPGKLGQPLPWQAFFAFRMFALGLAKPCVSTKP